MDNGELGSYASWGTYTIPAETNLKQYYIKGEYTDAYFGTGKVIAPIEGNDDSKNDRFYVMALNNFTTENNTTFYWYNSAYGNLDSSYNVSTSANDFAVAGAEPTGRINTQRMITAWNAGSGTGGYGEQNARDMWGVIQEEVANGWFVPSKSEWAAFGAAFDITSSTYSTFGLSGNCWSSSQYGTSTVYVPDFHIGGISYDLVSDSYFVRLATTF